MKRISFLFIFMIALCLSASYSFADNFSDDPLQINQAAKSVMKLEILDKNGENIKIGSGFVAFDNRHLITNYHVADGADMIYAYSDAGDPYIIMDVCISDSKKDIAVLQFFSPTDMSPLALNESGEVIRASSVVAIGSPKGFSNSISSGIVSSVFEEDGCGYIQFTASISSGSSGGALFNDDGEVIGITSMNYDDGMGVSQNLNFAVNIKEAIALFANYDGSSHSLSDLNVTDASLPKETPTPESTKTPVETNDQEQKRSDLVCLKIWVPYNLSLCFDDLAGKEKTVKFRVFRDGQKCMRSDYNIVNGTLIEFKGIGIYTVYADYGDGKTMREAKFEVYK